MTKSIRTLTPELIEAHNMSPEWIKTEGSVLANPRIGVYFIRVVMMEGDKPLYDFVLRAERGGGIFVPVDEWGRIGLQEMWRPQVRDQERYAEAFPAFNPGMLGRVSYEVPRGFGEAGETVSDAAVREAQEETHGRVSEVHGLGPICDNTALSPHLADAVWGRLDLPADGWSSDSKEGIVGRIRFFTREELAVLQSEGKLYDGFTLAALALLWIRYPELWKEAGI